MPCNRGILAFAMVADNGFGGAEFEQHVVEIQCWALLVKDI